MKFLQKQMVLALYAMLYSMSSTAQTQATITISDPLIVKDAMIFRHDRPGYEHVVNTNYGAYPRLASVAWTSSGSVTFQRSLIYFNTSIIPEGSTVHSATLYLYSDPSITSPNDASGNSKLSGSNAFYLERVTQEWDEQNVTWYNQPASTTTGRIWVGPSSSPTENRIINITSIAQQWIDNPLINNGLKMILENEVHYRSRNYGSIEHPNENIRPRLVITYTPYAGEGTCATYEVPEEELKKLPWYDKDDFLADYQDSLDQAWAAQVARMDGDIEFPKWRIPVQFWVYQIANGNAGGTNRLPEEEDFQRIMDAVNIAARLNGLKFRYYIDAITFINDQNSVVINNDVEGLAVTASHKDTDALNVHIVDAITDRGGPSAGTYFTLTNAIIIDRGIMFTQANAGVFAHEVGHYFGLEHTHANRGTICFREPVTRGYKATACPAGYRKRCRVTGDLFCDTDADPDMSIRGSYNDSNCTWDAQGTRDFYGDLFHPDANNYMAYGNRGVEEDVCRWNFTKEQITAMYYRANTSIIISLWKNINLSNQFDRYEPDDADRAARPIIIGEAQTHTFHTKGRSDDVDWLSFDNTNGTIYSSRLEITKTTANPVGAVQFFQATIVNDELVRGAPLAGIASSTSGNKITYTIPCTSVPPGGIYLIQIPRGSGGYQEYDIKLSRVTSSPINITGPDAICSSGTFNLNNAPSNSAISWVPSQEVAYVSGGGTSYTVRPLSGTQAFVQVTVTSSGCSETLTKTFSLENTVSGHTVSGEDEVCHSQSYTYMATVPGGHRSSYQYNWSIPSGWLIENQGGNSITVRIPAYGFYGGTVSYTVSTLCSISARSPYFVVQNACYGSNAMAIYPNPSSVEDEVILQSTADDNEDKKIYEVKILDKTGTLVQTKNFSKPETSKKINIKALPADDYFFLVFDGSEWETLRFLKEKAD